MRAELNRDCSKQGLHANIDFKAGKPDFGKRRTMTLQLSLKLHSHSNNVVMAMTPY